MKRQTHLGHIIGDVVDERLCIASTPNEFDVHVGATGSDEILIEVIDPRI
jgi:hypothetical protein